MQIITGAVGEELGWRGFLLPRLRKYYGPVTAARVMQLLDEVVDLLTVRDARKRGVLTADEHAGVQARQ